MTAFSFLFRAGSSVRAGFLARAWAIALCLLILPAASFAAPGSSHDGSARGEQTSGKSTGPSDGHQEAGHHAAPTFADINWFYGLIGEREGVQPGLLFRPVGMPVPLGSLLINSGILFFLIWKLGGPAIAQGLVSRKQRIAGDIEAAAEMKKDAERQLAHYEGKLKEVGEEMERIKKEMRLQAEADRKKIVEEAKARAVALEAEAKILIDQERAHARHEATKAALVLAVKEARSQIESRLTAEDQERLASDLLTSVERHFSSQGAPS